MATTLPASSPASANAKNRRARAASLLQRQGVLIVLVIVIVLAGLRYDNFLSWYNIGSLLRNNAMFGLISLGMTFVIMTGGIDLSVGSVAALASVLAANFSTGGSWLAIGVPVLVGLGVGFINGFIITKMNILPFIVTLAMLLGARGMALVLANNRSVSVPPGADFRNFANGDFVWIPTPVWVVGLAFALGSLVLNLTRFGRHVLAVGGNEEASRLMGLKVDSIKIGVYTLSGGLAALAGVVLASLNGAGQPTEGAGWELTAIAAVVVGGTLLSGGAGSVFTSLIGAILLAVILNILNFENGHGQSSLSVYWQSVIRGGFLLVVVLLQSRLARRRQT